MVFIELHWLITRLQCKEVSYDIMGLDERVLFKHVEESDVYGFQKIDEECERYWIQK